MIYTLTPVLGARSNSPGITGSELDLVPQPSGLSFKSIGKIFLSVAVVLSVFLSGCSDGKKTSFMQKGKRGSTAKSIYIPPEDDIIEDADTGLDIIKNVIVIAFNPDTDEATIEKIIASTNGKIVGYDKAVNFYQVKYPGADLATMDSIRFKLLSGFKEVEMTGRATTSVHKDPYYVK